MKMNVGIEPVVQQNDDIPAFVFHPEPLKQETKMAAASPLAATT